MPLPLCKVSVATTVGDENYGHKMGSISLRYVENNQYCIARSFVPRVNFDFKYLPPIPYKAGKINVPFSISS